MPRLDCPSVSAETSCNVQVDIKVDKVRNYYAGQLGTAKMIFNPDTRGYEEL